MRMEAGAKSVTELLFMVCTVSTVSAVAAVSYCSAGGAGSPGAVCAACRGEELNISCPLGKIIHLDVIRHYWAVDQTSSCEDTRSLCQTPTMFPEALDSCHLNRTCQVPVTQTAFPPHPDCGGDIVKLTVNYECRPDFGVTDCYEDTPVEKCKACVNDRVRLHCPAGKLIRPVHVTMLFDKTSSSSCSAASTCNETRSDLQVFASTCADTQHCDMELDPFSGFNSIFTCPLMTLLRVYVGFKCIAVSTSQAPATTTTDVTPATTSHVTEATARPSPPPATRMDSTVVIIISVTIIAVLLATVVIIALVIIRPCRRDLYLTQTDSRMVTPTHVVYDSDDERRSLGVQV